MDTKTFVWAVLAAGLLIVEMLAGTVYLLAWAAGAAVGAGVQWVSGSWLAAALAAATIMVGGSLLARRIRRHRQPPLMRDPDAGGTARLLRPVAGAQWRVAFRGTEWDARLAVGVDQAVAGAEARVVGREANTLILEIP